MTKKHKITAIIQARMGSTRLPGKVIKDICGKPLLQHIIERVRYSKLINEVVVATTNNIEDDVVRQICRKLNIECFRGNDEDVLDRFYQCAKKYCAEIIVRITGDCPFADPDIIDMTVKSFIENNSDYVSTAYPEASFPDGLDIEVFSYNALEIAWREAKLLSEREHVTSYIWKNESGQFKIENIKNDIDLSDKRWTIDEGMDLNFVRKIYSELYKENSLFKFKDILDYLKRNPELEKINTGIQRNEGYMKSLERDRTKGV